jgi:ATP-binding cassette, subfamily B, bacterial
MKSESSRSQSAGLWQFLRMASPYRGRISLGFMAMLMDAALTILRPWPLKVVIDRVISHTPRATRVPFLGSWLDGSGIDRMSILYGACAATLLIALGTGLLTYWYTRVLGVVAQYFVFELRRKLFGHMQRLSLRFHDRQRTGDLITRLTSDIQAMQDIVANGTIVLGSNALLLVGMLVMMFWLNWQFAFVALSVLPLLSWSIFRYTHRIRAASRRARESTGSLAAFAQETLSSIRIVQGLAQEEQQDERFEAECVISLGAFLEGVRYQARIAPLVDVLAALGLSLVMWYGATEVLQGTLTIGDVVVFFAYVTNLYAPIRALSKSTYSFARAAVGAERISEILLAKSEVIDCKPARPMQECMGTIEFRDVCFEYEPGQRVLSHINLVVNAGETVAIVGVTGAGKSTLVGLVPRFYDPTSGAVLIDGKDIRNYSLQSLREHISLVLQDSLLFSGSVWENIAFGCPNATEGALREAAKLANADEFINRLPSGYDTPIAEAGATLSGGQKQRIAIARAALRDAPIFILDEPTSGLDAASERAVIEALDRAAKGRTTLIIAHRLTTVRFAHRIVVLDGGEIVEEGTHAQLIARNGRYTHLCGLQVMGPNDAYIERIQLLPVQAPNRHAGT